MITDQILTMLIAERDKLNLAIAALQGDAAPKRRGRPAKNGTTQAEPPTEKPTRKKRNFSPAQRKAAAKRMKQYWAAKRKAAQ